MTIPKAGRERDKIISKMKGWEVSSHEQYPEICYKENEMGVISLSNYSTSRNDAFNLEREFVHTGGKYYCNVFRGCFGYIAYLSLEEPTKSLFSTSWVFKEIESDWKPTLDEAIADAVSLAWIKWKEANNDEGVVG